MRTGRAITTTTSALLAGAAACALALSGCGGSGSSTVSTSSSTTAGHAIVSPKQKTPPLVSAVDHVCTTFQGRINPIGTPPFSPTAAAQKDLPAAARYLAKVVPLAQAEAQHVGAVLAGAGKRYRSTAEAFAAVARDEAQELAAARIGDLRGFYQAVTNYETDARTLGVDAIGSGFGVCVSA